MPERLPRSLTSCTLKTTGTLSWSRMETHTRPRAGGERALKGTLSVCQVTGQMPHNCHLIHRLTPLSRWKTESTDGQHPEEQRCSPGSCAPSFPAHGRGALHPGKGLHTEVAPCGTQRSLAREGDVQEPRAITHAGALT